ncbi:conserved protein of unknown function [Streptantibioticus cattleyicolor NRRL 8057 = DSM 46488]|nr:conserved protein of unknown function [Streptantibioticus cattleyicolor NRRL 8057 = DSM 46488]
MATTVRRTSITLSAAPVGPDNPLPALGTPDEVHRLDERERAALPADMARQIGYAPLRSVLPVRIRDGYGRDRAPVAVDALRIENDRVAATVLPGYGGRVHSLTHKATGRELLHRNPVLQPANFGLADAWFAGGIEWNIGATGHTTLTCAPLHAARVVAPDGGEMLRLWEWERLRDVPFQVDLWLPHGCDFLLVGVRIRNPHPYPVPVYWWSNTAVAQTPGTRVLVPADHAWHFGYERALRRIPVPRWNGADRTYATRTGHAADFFYDVPATARPWIAALGEDGHGLVQTSTAELRGRKLFVWGNGTGGQRWQRWLSGPDGGDYLEIQAGLARTQLEHVPLDAGAEVSWLEAYGPLEADPAVVHGDDWTRARTAVAERLDAVLPDEWLRAAAAEWSRCADTEPKEMLAAGSGWGALEVQRGGYELPGTPFGAASLGASQRPWLELLHTGEFPDRPGPLIPLDHSLVAPHWRDLLEAAPSGCAADYHLGVAQWYAGDRAQAVRSWERSLRHAVTPWALRCLAVADAEAGEPRRAAERYAEAFAHAAGSDADPDLTTAALTALAREAVPALLAVGRADEAAAILEQLPDEVRSRGRFRLLTARTSLARGDAPAARALFDAGFEVADLREGDEVLAETWFAIAERLVAGDGPVTEETRRRARTEHPLPPRYDFRMRPA